MTAVSNASPLITLARARCLHLLPRLFDEVHIPPEVYREVVTDGQGMPGATEVRESQWILVTPVEEPRRPSFPPPPSALGAGEISAVLLARQLEASVVLMDEVKGRRFAVANGIRVAGSVGLLEELLRRDLISNLRDTYRELLGQKIRLDRRVVNESLARFHLPPL